MLRNYRFYYDESTLSAVRVGDYKAYFGAKLSPMHPGRDEWFDPYAKFGALRVVNLRADPFEHHMDTNIGKMIMNVDKMWNVLPAFATAMEHLATFKKYPVRQKAASLNPDF